MSFILFDSFSLARRADQRTLALWKMIYCENVSSMYERVSLFSRPYHQYDIKFTFFIAPNMAWRNDEKFFHRWASFTLPLDTFFYRQTTSSTFASLSCSIAHFWEWICRCNETFPRLFALFITQKCSNILILKFLCWKILLQWENFTLIWSCEKH